MIVTIEQVSNGYLIKHGDKTYVAIGLRGYSYSDTSVEQVLKQIFEAEQK